MPRPRSKSYDELIDNSLHAPSVQDGDPGVGRGNDGIDADVTGRQRKPTQPSRNRSVSRTRRAQKNPSKNEIHPRRNNGGNNKRHPSLKAAAAGAAIETEYGWSRNHPPGEQHRQAVTTSQDGDSGRMSRRKSTGASTGRRRRSKSNPIKARRAVLVPEQGRSPTAEHEAADLMSSSQDQADNRSEVTMPTSNATSALSSPAAANKDQNGMIVVWRRNRSTKPNDAQNVPGMAERSSCTSPDGNDNNSNGIGSPNNVPKMKAKKPAHLRVYESKGNVNGNQPRRRSSRKNNRQSKKIARESGDEVTMHWHRHPALDQQKTAAAARDALSYSDKVDKSALKEVTKILGKQKMIENNQRVACTVLRGRRMQKKLNRSLGTMPKIKVAPPTKATRGVSCGELDFEPNEADTVEVVEPHHPRTSTSSSSSSRGRRNSSSRTPVDDDEGNSGSRHGRDSLRGRRRSRLGIDSEDAADAARSSPSWRRSRRLGVDGEAENQPATSSPRKASSSPSWRRGRRMKMTESEIDQMAAPLNDQSSPSSRRSRRLGVDDGGTAQGSPSWRRSRRVDDDNGDNSASQSSPSWRRSRATGSDNGDGNKPDSAGSRTGRSSPSWARDLKPTLNEVAWH